MIAIRRQLTTLACSSSASIRSQSGANQEMIAIRGQSGDHQEAINDTRLQQSRADPKPCRAGECTLLLCDQALVELVHVGSRMHPRERLVAQRRAPLGHRARRAPCRAHGGCLRGRPKQPIRVHEDTVTLAVELLVLCDGASERVRSPPDLFQAEAHVTQGEGRGGRGGRGGGDATAASIPPPSALASTRPRPPWPPSTAASPKKWFFF